MKKPLIIGIGNPFRSDDGCGLTIAKILQEHLQGDADCLTCSGDPMSLMELWKGRETVFLIDAVLSKTKQVGYIHHFHPSVETIPGIFTNTSTHLLDVIQIIELAKALDKIPTDLYLFGIETKEHAMQEGISPELEKKLPEITEQIAKNILKTLL